MPTQIKYSAFSNKTGSANNNLKINPHFETQFQNKIQRISTYQYMKAGKTPQEVVSQQ